MIRTTDKTIVLNKAMNLPVFPSLIYSFAAPGSFQYLKPNLSWLGPPPQNKMKETNNNPSIMTTFVPANQNSVSP
jgi:hypothetical protein